MHDHDLPVVALKSPVGGILLVDQRTGIGAAFEPRQMSQRYSGIRCELPERQPGMAARGPYVLTSFKQAIAAA